MRTLGGTFAAGELPAESCPHPADASGRFRYLVEFDFEIRRLGSHAWPVRANRAVLMRRDWTAPGGLSIEESMGQISWW